MTKTISELFGEKEFIYKVVDLVSSAIGLYYWYFFGCTSVLWEITVLYWALTGGVTCSALMVGSYQQDERSDFYEEFILYSIGALNLVAAYIYYKKVFGSVNCMACKTDAYIFLCCLLCGVYCAIGLYLWHYYGCAESLNETLIIYWALSGGMTSSAIIMGSLICGMPNCYYEDMNLLIYGILNILAAYKYYYKASRALYCGFELEVLFSPNLLIFFACVLAGVSMLIDAFKECENCKNNYEITPIKNK